MHVLSFLMVMMVSCTINAESMPNEPSTFMTSEAGKEFLNFMNLRFSHSMISLYTSEEYGSQYMQRPGMAKLLKEHSDFEWNQGLDLLKKYMQRGGRVNQFREILNVKGQGNLTLVETEDKVSMYKGTIANLTNDAEYQFSIMNNLHHMATGTKNIPRDYEIGHYLDDKLENKAEFIYKLKQQKIMFANMDSLGIAVQTFDSSL